ncbi:MAG TPA: hypothetical protein PLP83_07115 [Candidatus Aminicenantes bacterium]|nr:hypothetical protein [Candidatus Aminicenantes bacterium]
MSANAEPRAHSTGLLEDIEKRVSEIFSAQKNEVEQGLIERINREKMEAQRRIEAVNQEFAQVRAALDGHKTVMADLQSAEVRLRGEIRGHFERAANYQKMMENAAALAGDELGKIGGLNQELEGLRVKAEREYEVLKTHLAGYAGVLATIPAPPARTVDLIDWTEEMDKLRQVRDLLATLRQPEPGPDIEPVPAPEPAGTPGDATAPAAPEAEELAASLGLMDDDDVMKDEHDFAVPGTPDEAPAPSPAPDADAGFQFEAPATEEIEPETGPEPSVEAAPAPAPHPALEALERYRRTEAVNNGIELGFFATDTVAVLDAEAFMTAVGKVVDAAAQIHGQLSKAASVKDLFLLKQEILNQQEVLRKLFFRVVRFCDKEGGRLPEQLGLIITSQGMKDVIERLTMANWSDPSDFSPFQTELLAMKRAFQTRAATGPNYYAQVLDQVEGRDN